MKASCADFRESFSKLPKHSIKLPFLTQYLKKESGIFIHKKTGVVTSELTKTPDQILHYWSEKIFKSKNHNDYSAFYPFARARLYYVTRTLIDFLSPMDGKISICDFGTGQGVLPQLLKREKPNWKVSCTEGSPTLVKSLRKKGLSVYQANLGKKELPYFQADVGILTWTLCNCPQPLKVLLEIREKIRINGYLLIADSSRVLVPFKKSLNDLLTKNHPADIHPYFFTKNSMQALAICAGFEPVFINRYTDSDILLQIFKKRKTIPNDKRQIMCDNYKQIIQFFRIFNKINKTFSLWNREQTKSA